jgi:hypothetical protein
MQRLHVGVLSDERERAAPMAQGYGKSLLYLVCAALESDARTPLLGLARAWQADASGWDGASATASVLKQWRDAAEVAHLDARLSVLSQAQVCCAPGQFMPSGHGCFEHDVATLNQTLHAMLGAAPAQPVRDLRGL